MASKLLVVLASTLLVLSAVAAAEVNVTGLIADLDAAYADFASDDECFVYMNPILNSAMAGTRSTLATSLPYMKSSVKTCCEVGWAPCVFTDVKPLIKIVENSFGFLDTWANTGRDVLNNNAFPASCTDLKARIAVAQNALGALFNASKNC